MGINGLLPCLTSITRPAQLDNYRGLTAAVDAMAWLHKGVFSCDVRSLAKYQRASLIEKEKQLRLGKREVEATVRKRLNFDNAILAKGSRLDRRVQNVDDGSIQQNAEERASARAAMEKCVSFVMRYAEVLRCEYGMSVILVIDGAPLPAKGGMDQKRRNDRNDAFLQAMEADKVKDSRTSRRLFARACSVTYEMRFMLICACKRSGIGFLVAPYEADAQMARLAHTGVVDLVISEDSDLLAYGCPRVLYKLDLATRRGDEIQLVRDIAMNQALCFRHWTHDMFVYMCIVAGCDYCGGIDGIGIKRAHKLVRMNRTPTKIFAALRQEGRCVPEDYEDSFQKAFQTFRHQSVYCPERGLVEALFPLNQNSCNYSTDGSLDRFLGAWIEPQIATGVACGLLHPVEHVTWEKALAQVQQNLSVLGHPASESNWCATKSDKSQVRPDYKHCDGSQDTKGNQGEIEKENNIFAFFDSKSKRPKHMKRVPDCRPPLQEIFVNRGVAKQNTSTGSLGISDVSIGRAQPIPIHFDEYKSKLVGTSFETLSRRCRDGGRARRQSSIFGAVNRLRMQNVNLKRPTQRAARGASKAAGAGIKRREQESSDTTAENAACQQQGYSFDAPPEKGACRHRTGSHGQESNLKDAFPNTTIMHDKRKSALGSKSCEPEKLAFDVGGQTMHSTEIGKNFLACKDDFPALSELGISDNEFTAPSSDCTEMYAALAEHVSHSLIMPLCRFCGSDIPGVPGLSTNEVQCDYCFQNSDVQDPVVFDVSWKNEAFGVDFNRISCTSSFVSYGEPTYIDVFSQDKVRQYPTIVEEEFQGVDIEKVVWKNWDDLDKMNGGGVPDTGQRNDWCKMISNDAISLPDDEAEGTWYAKREDADNPCNYINPLPACPHGSSLLDSDLLDSINGFMRV